MIYTDLIPFVVRRLLKEIGVTPNSAGTAIVVDDNDRDLEQQSTNAK